VPASSAKPAYQVRAGVVLSRPPQITRDLTPFEKAFYLYQRRLNERLALPAMQYFYFRANSPAMIEFKRKRKMRKGVAARDIGVYNPYDKLEGWNDELLLGDQISEPEWQANELIKDSIPLPKDNEGEEVGVAPGQEPVQRLMPRVTEADEKRDQRSLNRLLQRTLYLLVQNGKGDWTFPEDVLVGRESLALVRKTGQVNHCR
jgi:large subunit ribosomal protein L46